ncbi:hypothetical protein ACOSQ3_026474 [Xanthoceras sorbifolium]
MRNMKKVYTKLRGLILKISVIHKNQVIEQNHSLPIPITKTGKINKIEKACSIYRLLLKQIILCDICTQISKPQNTARLVINRPEEKLALNKLNEIYICGTTVGKINKHSLHRIIAKDWEEKKETTMTLTV